MTILSAEDRPATLVSNESAASPIILLGDHAGRAIPVALGDLGLSGPELDRHIAWDIGIAGLGAVLSQKLDAVFINQRYSRLVIDCNRALSSPTSIPEISDGTVIPGNIGLAAADRRKRVDGVYRPYHDRIAAKLLARKERSQPSILVSVHSFTPIMDDAPRPWRMGVLHRNDSPFALRILEKLRASLGDAVGDNEPYAMDVVDYTIPFHADAFSVPYVELEVRQDLIADEHGQREIGAFLADMLSGALIKA